MRRRRRRARARGSCGPCEDSACIPEIDPDLPWMPWDPWDTREAGF